MVMPSKPDRLPCSNAECFRCGGPLAFDTQRREMVCESPNCPGPRLKRTEKAAAVDHQPTPKKETT